jgi:hypothetical protein
VLGIGTGYTLLCGPVRNKFLRSFAIVSLVGGVLCLVGRPAYLLWGVLDLVLLGRFFLSVEESHPGSVPPAAHGAASSAEVLGQSSALGRTLRRLHPADFGDAPDAEPGSKGQAASEEHRTP